MFVDRLESFFLSLKDIRLKVFRMMLLLYHACVDLGVKKAHLDYLSETNSKIFNNTFWKIEIKAIPLKCEFKEEKLKYKCQKYIRFGVRLDIQDIIFYNSFLYQGRVKILTVEVSLIRVLLGISLS